MAVVVHGTMEPESGADKMIQYAPVVRFLVVRVNLNLKRLHSEFIDYKKFHAANQ